MVQLIFCHTSKEQDVTVTGKFHNMSSPSAMIQDLCWRDLNQRRVDSRLCMLDKISQCLVNISIGQFLKYNRNGVHVHT